LEIFLRALFLEPGGNGLGSKLLNVESFCAPKGANIMEQVISV